MAKTKTTKKTKTKKAAAKKAKQAGLVSLDTRTPSPRGGGVFRCLDTAMPYGVYSRRGHEISMASGQAELARVKKERPAGQALRHLRRYVAQVRILAEGALPEPRRERGGDTVVLRQAQRERGDAAS